MDISITVYVIISKALDREDYNPIDLYVDTFGNRDDAESEIEKLEIKNKHMIDYDIVEKVIEVEAEIRDN